MRDQREAQWRILWAPFKQSGNDQRLGAPGDLTNLRGISSRKESLLNQRN
jgi:hypothetical protein